MTNKLKIASALACLFLMSGTALAGDETDWLAPNEPAAPIQVVPAPTEAPTPFVPKCDDESVIKTVLDQVRCPACSALNITAEQFLNLSDEELRQVLWRYVLETQAKEFNTTSDHAIENYARANNINVSVATKFFHVYAQKYFEGFDAYRKANFKVNIAYATDYNATIAKYNCIAELSFNANRLLLFVSKLGIIGALDHNPRFRVIIIAGIQDEMKEPNKSGMGVDTVFRMGEAKVIQTFQSMYTSPHNIKYSVQSTSRGKLVLVQKPLYNLSPEL